MARKRIIYQSEALYAGKTGAASATQLHRVQDISHSVDVTRTDVNEFGTLAALSREIIESPTVSLDFSYFIVDGDNENNGLGFDTGGSNNALSKIIDTAQGEDERNYFIVTVGEGDDVRAVSNAGVIGIGNGYITSYTVDASVGEIPSASVSVEGANIRFQTGVSSAGNPSIDVSDGSAIAGTVTIPAGSTGSLSAAALRPGDVTITFGSSNLQMGGAVLPGMGSETANVQSFSLDMPLSRTPLNRIGNAFPFSRELDFPINATLSVTANLTSISEGALRDLICNDADKRDITITMKIDAELLLALLML